jgi:hypothetical protein
MSCLPKGRTARRGPKVTERPSGLDEPLARCRLVLAPTGGCAGGTRNRGSFVFPPCHPPIHPDVCTPFYPQCCGHPLWGQRMHDGLTTFRSALVGGLAAAVVLSHRVSSYGGMDGTADRPPPPVFFNGPQSGRTSAWAPRSGRGPAVPTGRFSCVLLSRGRRVVRPCGSRLNVGEWIAPAGRGRRRTTCS